MVTLPRSASYFAQAAPYLRRNFWIQMRSEIVRDLIEAPRNKRILDLGCGNGAISLPWSQNNEVVLVDNSASMLRGARANAQKFNPANCRFVDSDVGELDLGTFDIVLAIGLFAHVDSVEETMANISRHVTLRGTAILQFSPSERLLNRVGLLLLRLRGRGYHQMTSRDVLQAASRSGLTYLTERTHLAVLPGMQRLMGRVLIPYDRFVRRHPALAKHGTETILVLRKDK